MPDLPPPRGPAPDENDGVEPEQDGQSRFDELRDSFSNILSRFSRGRIIGITVPPEDKALYSWGKALQPALDPKEINVLIWNTHKGVNDDWPTDMVNMGVSFDLMLLQEAHLSSSMLSAAGQLSDIEWKLAASFCYSDGSPTGVATGSKVVPSQIKIIRSDGREPILETPKSALVTLYPLQGAPKPLMTANFHGLNFVSQKLFEEQINDVASIMAQYDGPLLFGGDFNAWSPMRVDYLFMITKQLGLEQVRLQSRRVLSLDRVFVRGLEVEFASILKHVLSSDHKPICLRLKVLQNP